MNIFKTLTLATFFVFGLVSTSHATIIAVVDSGTDLNHKDLVNKKWVNPIDIDDAVDNDDNGYIDDINGWNFAENNNKLIDMSFLGTFSADVYKYFEVQTRALRGEATAEDLAWIKKMQADAKFIGQLGTFGNFVHGTHVAGIVAKNADLAKVMVLKLMATKAPGTSAGKFEDATDPVVQASKKSLGKDDLIKFGLKLLASQQGKALAPIGKYLKAEKARVANCSFGTSTAAAKQLLAPILKIVLKRDATPAELLDYSKFFVAEVVKSSVELTKPAPTTLFVIAAGNDGSNNDELPTSPENNKAQNTISVAATFGYQKIASFSNYGDKMVEVAAPGVGILSSIPGDQYLTVSGTSQASPFVANIAGLILDANPNLSNTDVKAILMGTVDKKEFLKGKVAAAGIVNVNRAVTAAKLALHMQLTQALESARAQINDVDHGFMMGDVESMSEGFVMPLAPQFN